LDSPVSEFTGTCLSTHPLNIPTMPNFTGSSTMA
jgi:hypothetical protein